MIRTSYEIIGSVYAMATFILCYRSDSEMECWIWIVAGMVLAAIHIALVRESNEKYFWGNRKGSFFVIDRGTLPRDFELPEHLEGQYLFCSAAQVRKKEKWVEDKLKSSGNDYYAKGLLDVNIVYFRYGARCNETEEEFVSYLIEAIESDRVAFQVMILKLEEKGKLKAGTYERQFLQSGLNANV